MMNLHKKMNDDYTSWNEVTVAEVYEAYQESVSNDNNGNED